MSTSVKVAELLVTGMQEAFLERRLGFVSFWGNPAKTGFALVSLKGKQKSGAKQAAHVAEEFTIRMWCQAVGAGDLREFPPQPELTARGPETRWGLCASESVFRGPTCWGGVPLWLSFKKGETGPRKKQDMQLESHAVGVRV